MHARGYYLINKISRAPFNYCTHKMALRLSVHARGYVLLAVLLLYLSVCFYCLSTCWIIQIPVLMHLEGNDCDFKKYEQ